MNYAAGRRNLLPGAVFPLVCLIIVWIPLPWGSNRVWSWALFELSVFGLLAIWAALHITRPWPLQDHDNNRFFLLGSVWLGFQCVYLLPVPDNIVLSLAPATAEMYQAVDRMAEGAGTQYFFSLNPHVTLAATLKVAAYLALCYLVVAALTSKKRLRVLLWVLLAVGVLQSVFGLYASFTGLRLVPDDLTDGHWDSVIGTFVNRNHFSAHLAMTAVAGFALLLPHLSRRQRPEIWRGRLARQAERLSTEPGIAVLMMVIIFAALFASGSRGAVAALMSALFIVLLIMRLGRGRDTVELRLLPVVLLVLAGAVVWMGASDFLQRLVEVGVAPGERLHQWILTQALIQDHWLFGVGLGNYAVAFPMYRDGALRALTYDHAHNDYFELLAEQGMVGSLILALAIGWLLFILIRSAVRRHDKMVRGALFGSLVALMTMLIHGLVDFNFRIPANAGYFYVWAGIGLAARRLPHGS